MRLLIIISVSSRPGMSLVRHWQVAVADMFSFVFSRPEFQTSWTLAKLGAFLSHHAETSTSLMLSVVGTPLIPCFIASLIYLADVYLAQAYLHPLG